MAFMKGGEGRKIEWRGKGRWWKQYREPRRLWSYEEASTVTSTFARAYDREEKLSLTNGPKGWVCLSELESLATSTYKNGGALSLVSPSPFLSSSEDQARLSKIATLPPPSHALG
ncbi:uncharacterized protein UBRO_20104 [Ustilago bromivora]|uniref:Uncharacterized protein n=1 Tax=Ustilago bromivora TaxID=307758 RepID=A0A1K0GCD2_9BASI|nr:uncharacterized protein UBRO_20104 [Ustilago bromivora]